MPFVEQLDQKGEPELKVVPLTTNDIDSYHDPKNPLKSVGYSDAYDDLNTLVIAAVARLPRTATKEELSSAVFEVFRQHEQVCTGLEERLTEEGYYDTERNVSPTKQTEVFLQQVGQTWRNQQVVLRGLETYKASKSGNDMPELLSPNIVVDTDDATYQLGIQAGELALCGEILDALAVRNALPPSELLDQIQAVVVERYRSNYCEISGDYMFPVFREPGTPDINLPQP